MAASSAKPLVALCCLLAFCSVCSAQDSKPDIPLTGIYSNITDVAAYAASTKECSANDTLCQALKKLLIPPPPPAFPPGAPGPSPFGYCRKSACQRRLCLLIVATSALRCGNRDSGIGVTYLKSWLTDVRPVLSA